MADECCRCSFSSEIQYNRPFVDYVVGCDPASGVDSNFVANRLTLLYGIPSFAGGNYNNRPYVSRCDSRYRFYSALGLALVNTGLSPFPPYIPTYCIARYTRDFTMELAVPSPTGWERGAFAVDIDADGNMVGILYAGTPPTSSVFQGMPSVFKFDRYGNEVWRYDIPARVDFPVGGGTEYRFTDIAIDLDGNIAIVGEVFTSFFGHRTWIFLIDSDGNQVWEYINLGGSGLPSNTENVAPTRCCFGSDGTLYVGFKPNGVDSNTGVIPTTTYLAVAAYSGGSEVWRKTEPWVSGQQRNKFVGDLCLSPQEDQLALLFYRIHPDGGISFTARVDVYSGSNYGTLDFTHTQITQATGAGQMPRGLCFCAYDIDGILWAGKGFFGPGGRIYFYRPNGTQPVGPAADSTHNSFARLCLAPGRVPIFLP